MSKSEGGPTLWAAFALTAVATGSKIRRCRLVPVYFFDTRDDHLFIEDEEGFELPNIEAVKLAAARTLAEIARDVIPGSMKRTLTVEVRDEYQPVLEARLVFEAVLLVANPEASRAPGGCNAV